MSERSKAAQCESLLTQHQSQDEKTIHVQADEEQVISQCHLLRSGMGRRFRIIGSGNTTCGAYTLLRVQNSV